MGTFAYTYLLAETSAGLQEVRRPRHCRPGRLGVYLRRRSWHGASRRRLQRQHDRQRVRQRSLRLPRAGAGALLLDDYWLVNAAVSYKLQPGVELFGRVENLLDQRYQEVFGYDAAPITAFAGVKLTFGGPDGVGGTGAK